LEAGEDGVADPPFEASERFLVGLALGDLAVIVGAAGTVPVPDLGDRGHVEGVVDAPVPAQRQPAGLAVPRGHLDRGGAVVRSEVIPAGEPGHVGDVADHGAGIDRAEAEDLGEAGARGSDGRGQLLLGLAELGIQTSQVLQELAGQLAARCRDRPGRRDLFQDAGGVSCGDLLADAAGEQVAQYRVEPAGDLIAGPRQVAVPLGPLPRYRGYADTGRGGAGGRG